MGEGEKRREEKRGGEVVPSLFGRKLRPWLWRYTNMFIIIIIIIIIIIHVLYRRGRKVNVSVFTALLFKSFQDSRRHTHTALGDENSKV